MSILDTLTILGGLAAMTAVYLLATRLMRPLGRLKGVSIRLNPSTPKRSKGEVHRELWEQKGALDRAIHATAAATLANRPVRDLPDPPCEVEPPAAGPVCASYYSEGR